MQVRGQQYKYRGHIVHFLRDVGKQWLDFLSHNHPGYRDITVCQKRMSVLPEDGDVLDQMRLISLQCQIYYQRIQRWKHCTRTFLATSTTHHPLHDQRHNISLKCQIFGEHR
ncbi:hypothetical protein HRG_012979 [Hirsutella rhossiliensis]